MEAWQKFAGEQIVDECVKYVIEVKVIDPEEILVLLFKETGSNDIIVGTTGGNEGVKFSDIATGLESLAKWIRFKGERDGR